MPAGARRQLCLVVDQLRPIAPQVADKLEAMKRDLLADARFPPAHWSKFYSNNLSNDSTGS